MAASGIPHRWAPVVDMPVGLVTPVRLDRAGVTGPTPAQARGKSWVRTGHGWYVPAWAPRHLPEQLIVEQAVRLPPHGAVTGWAACRLHGAGLIDGIARDGRTRLPVPLNVGPSGQLATWPMSFPVNHVLLPPDRVTLHGIPTVVAARALYDAVRLTRGLRARVVLVDMMAAAEASSPRQLQAYATAQPQDRQRVLEAVALASEHSRSPRETELRLVLGLDAGITTVLVNWTVRDLAGRLLGIADLLDPVAGLVVELDGADHRTGTAQSNDLRRTDRLHGVGLEVCRVAGGETSDRQLVVHRVRSARARARFAAPDQRLWVATPPRHDLEQRIARRRQALLRTP